MWWRQNKQNNKDRQTEGLRRIKCDRHRSIRLANRLSIKNSVSETDRLAKTDKQAVIGRRNVIETKQTVKFKNCDEERQTYRNKTDSNRKTK